MGVEITSLRKKKTVKVPSGAMIEIWDKGTWKESSDVQAAVIASSDVNPQTGQAKMSNGASFINSVSQNLISRIVSWDYTENEKALDVSLENLMKLPEEDVEFLQKEIGITNQPSKNL
jgi:hypothetical protein